jgi:hypothetical protein
VLSRDPSSPDLPSPPPRPIPHPSPSPNIRAPRRSGLLDACAAARACTGRARVTQRRRRRRRRRRPCARPSLPRTLGNAVMVKDHGPVRGRRRKFLYRLDLVSALFVRQEGRSIRRRATMRDGSSRDGGTCRTLSSMLDAPFPVEPLREASLSSCCSVARTESEMKFPFVTRNVER